MKHKWPAVFFDFDGVILDSVDVKTQAFAAMFRKYGPEVEKAVIKYHLENGGVSRFKKFEHYYRYILGKTVSTSQLNHLGNKFTRIALDGVLSAPFIDGAIETLILLKKNKVPAFVVSGTPHDEIKLIVKKRKLNSYFQEVHGSPRKKQEILEDIAKRHGLNLPDCLFIGDAKTDYEAAKVSKTCFLGIVKNSESSPFTPDTNISTKVEVEI